MQVIFGTGTLFFFLNKKNFINPQQRIDEVFKLTQKRLF
jgi:hypothetical protein